VASPGIFLVNRLWTNSSKMISYLSDGDHSGLHERFQWQLPG